MSDVELQNERTIGDLSFASRQGERLDLWNPRASGNWSADNELGRALAGELIHYMRERNAPTVLGHVIQAMIGKGNFSGVEVGFANEIALLAM